MPSTQDDIAAIGGMLQQFIEAFCVVDSETMKSFFARDYPNIVHQSEENPRALTSYEQIADYWDNQVPNELEGIEKVEDTDLKIDVIGDLALVYLYALASAKFPGSEHIYKAPFRATIALKRIDGEWKFIQYHESRILDLDRVCEALNEGRADELAYGPAQRG